jgi:pimeloyl-ACP methyl ester carboxylesterase
MSAATSPGDTTTQPETTARKRGCLFTLLRVLKWLGILLLILIILGFAYQTLASEMDKRDYAPHGQLYTVNGHQMHLYCVGQGGPAVILEAGGYAESLWWYRIQNQLAEHTQVCAYDRPGLGWSEATTLPRDPVTIVGELHMLLSQAGIKPPYVLTGHSYGAILVRVFAHQYPADVSGLILVDSGLVRPAHFNSEAEFNEWKSSNDVLQVLLWGMTRVGLVRLLGTGDFSGWGYPAEIVPELVALHSTNQAFDTYYAEGFPVRPALQDAAAASENLGKLPLAILWAGEQPLHAQADLEIFAQAKQDMAAYSTNSLSRDIAGANHGSILGTEQYAQQVSDTVLNVRKAAQTGEPLAQ